MPLPSSSGGDPIAWLVWEVHRPAARMLSAMAPLGLALLVLCIVLAGLAFRNIGRVTGQVAQTMQRLADVNEKLAESHETEHRARLMAEEASRAKSVFLANASRELRTPLNAVIGISELMLLHAGEQPGGPDWGVRLSAIRDNAVALLRTINDLIDLSRAEVGRQRLEPEAIAAAPALERIRRRLSSVSEPRDIQIDLQDHAPGIEVWADPMAFDRMAATLLTNALTSSHAGGRVLVEIRKGSGDGPTIIVRDFGAGIPPERLPYVFQPFGEGLASGEPGTGLGLAIVKALMDLHKGSVTVDSEPRAGTTVSLAFPPAPQPLRRSSEPVAA